MEKKLSVIIPVYNTSKYIEKCLDSIANQSISNIEIIIVNDGSTDNSGEVIKKWISKNENKIQVKYFEKENGGLSDARNFGVKHATGDYLTFVDSDDYLDSNIYMHLKKHMNKEVELIKFKMLTVEENGKIIKKLDGPVFEICSGQEGFEKLCTKDEFLEVSCIYIYKKDFYVKNKFTFEINTYHEDFGLIPWIIINAKTMVSTEFYGYYYLKRENSITDTKTEEKEKKKAYDILKHYDNAIERIEKTKIDNKVIMMFKRYYTNTLLLKIEKLNGKDRKEFIKCIKNRKIYKNIKPENIKQLLKKILVMFNVNLYLKLR